MQAVVVGRSNDDPFDHQRCRFKAIYFYHNYIYIDSCFSFPFIRFAVVQMCMCSCFFFLEGEFPYDCYPLILGFFLLC